VIKGIQDLFPLAKQVRELGIENYSDRSIWDFARKEDYTIVTFDSDFFDLNLILGTPPKIIWLRIGNATSEDIIQLFRQNCYLITEFLVNPDFSQLGCLEIGRDIFEA
jgi:predicted nuclease of predicted toxin-antitoxin system